MGSIFFRKLRKGRRPRNRPDGKLHQIIDAGIRLLARKDFEAISMARLAREAGCSVGALYSRFPDKHSYLYRLISIALRSMQDSAATDLEASRWRHLPQAGRVELIVNHTVSKMASPRAAGIVRAAMKLATTRPLVVKLLEEYRATVTGHAVALLSSKSANAPTASQIRLTMQVIFATITDAVLQKQPGPMIAGSTRMKSALTNIARGYLGISKGGGWAGVEAKGQDEPVDDDVSEEMPASGSAVFDPDLRVFRRAKTSPAPSPAKRKAKSKSAPVIALAPVLAPPKAPKTK
jgi:AcrR family transcriptional regulator